MKILIAILILAFLFSGCTIRTVPNIEPRPVDNYDWIVDQPEELGAPIIEVKF